MNVYSLPGLCKKSPTYTTLSKIFELGRTSRDILSKVSLDCLKFTRRMSNEVNIVFTSTFTSNPYNVDRCLLPRVVTSCFASKIGQLDHGFSFCLKAIFKPKFLWRPESRFLFRFVK